jgi:hypothetical protein
MAKKKEENIESHLYNKQADAEFFESLKRLAESDDKEAKERFLKVLNEESKKMHPIFVEQCIEKGLFSQKYYEKELKGKYIEDEEKFATDTLTDLMRFWLSQQVLPKKDEDGEPYKHYFVTPNKAVLKDRMKLERLFGVTIRSIEESVIMMKKIEEESRKEDEKMEKLTGFRLEKDLVGE